MPNLEKLVMISDGKSSIYKGGPNFGVVIDIGEKFNLNQILLCFGATAHMSGSQDSIGKQPHTMATSYVNQCKLKYIYSAQEMYTFCVEHMPQPPLIVKRQPAPMGTMGGNSAYMFVHYNNGLTLVKNSSVKNIATVLGFNGGYNYDGLNGSSHAYSFSSLRDLFTHPNSLATKNARCGAARSNFACWTGTVPRAWKLTTLSWGNGAVRRASSARNT